MNKDDPYADLRPLDGTEIRVRYIDHVTGDGDSPRMEVAESALLILPAHDHGDDQ